MKDQQPPLPHPHTPEEEAIVEILTAPIETDDDYKKLAELADDGE